jgi:hypothetical protein
MESNTYLINNSQTGVQIENSLPSYSMLNQNYPNPFNPSTVISYRLSVSSNVKLTIYNILGQKIKTLVNSFQSAGEHTIVWNGTDERDQHVSSGMYIYRLETMSSTTQRKMLFIQ